MPQENQQAQNRNGESLLMRFLKMIFWFWMIRNIMASIKMFTNSNLEGGDAPQENKLRNLWADVSNVELKVYFSDFKEFSIKESTEIWNKKLNLKDIKTDRLDFNYTLSEKLKKNSTFYAHAFLSNGHDQIHARKSVTYLAPVVKNVKKNLLDDNKDEAVSMISTHWWPNITITVVDYFGVLGSKLPPKVVESLVVTRDGYYPIFFINDFWMLQDHLMQLNETVEQVPVYLEVTSIPMWKFQLYKQFEESFKMQNEMMGVPNKDTDELKRLFLETNPILLSITFAVSILHSIFDFLAFKNDVEFWKNRSNLDGLSFRTIILNIFFQGVIFLYLLDNETSWMILISSGVGLLIEIWKVNKSVIVKRSPNWPFVVFESRVKPSKLTKKTQKYDEMAFGYLSYVLYPCLAGYTIYSLLYEKHKGWYSFVISTLVGFVYAFGFISMTPQLFINYKLKSVAHMPWKTFMYKALNTFIDDLFAFVVKMPMMHRLACLRDDVVFLVYLYQKWIYPEDKRRRNEFGQVGEGDGADEDSEESDSDDSPTQQSAVKGSPAKASSQDDSNLRQRKLSRVETGPSPSRHFKPTSPTETAIGNEGSNMINVEFLICVAGVYVCFLTWGITQERVSTTSYNGQKFKYFVLLNAFQSLAAFIMGSIYSLRLKPIQMSRDLFWNYLKVSLIQSLASPFGYAALKHIDYPTIILGKSCKLVPVMAMNFILYRKMFPLYKYLTVVLISAGVSGFTLLHSQEAQEKGSSLWGLFLLGINLILDGATNSTQDVIFHRFKVSGAHMMTNMNGFSFVLMGLYLVLNPWSSELSDGISFISLHPAVLRDILIFSVTGSLGQLFIFYMLQRFGSLSLVTVTVTRKMFSILLSVFLFGHKIGITQWMAVGLVFLGIGLDSYCSRKEKLAKLVAAKKSDDREAKAFENPKKQKSSPKRADKTNNLPENKIENVIESDRSNRRRSSRLQAKQN